MLARAGAAPPAPPRRSLAASMARRPNRRAGLRVAALLSDRGQRLHPDRLAPVGSVIGEGSFGQVFAGVYSTPAGDDEPVILKRVRPLVSGAAEMAAMEHLINVHAARNCRGHVADFLGYCEASESDAAASAPNQQRGGFFFSGGGGSSLSSSSSAPSSLTPGLWLVWRYEGTNTLAYYLRRRDALRALARDLGVPEDASKGASSASGAADPARGAEALAAALALRHVLSALASLHGAGLVHRDVKPLNLILSERDRRLKLIDLGAAADLRGGTNYKPEESILDPLYAPPEQYALPTSSVDLQSLGGGALAAMAVSPVLWAAHRPDRFDSWSAGVVLLQLALPAMRAPKALAAFKAEYSACGHDLRAWRRSCRWLPRRDWAVLDCWQGSGWDLAQGLLQPRANLEFGEDGGVTFSAAGAGSSSSGGGGSGGSGGGGGSESGGSRSGGSESGGGGTTRAGGSRLSASEALRHPFLRAAGVLEKQLSGAAARGAAAASAAASASASPGGSGAVATPSPASSRQRGGGASPEAAAAAARATPAERRARVREQQQQKQQQQRQEEEAQEERRRREQLKQQQAGSSRGLLSAAASTWRSLSDRLFDLEASVYQAATESATATAKVKKLEERAAKRGEARAAAALPEAQLREGRARARLETLRREAADVSARARGIWGLLGIGKPGSGGKSAGSGGGGADKSGAGSGAAAAASAAASAAAAAPAASSSSSSSSSSAAAVASAAAAGGSALAGFLSGAWGALGERLVALEGAVAAAEREAESSTAKVRRLRKQVAAASAPAADEAAAAAAAAAAQEELRREERALAERERALGEARGRYEGAWRRATAALAGMVLPVAGEAGEVEGAPIAKTPAAPEGTGRGRSPLAGFAYAGLRLGGLAAKIVADAVAAAGADAYRAVAALEAEGEARARARAADAAFLDALRALLGDEAVAADVVSAVVMAAAGVLGSDEQAQEEEEEQQGDDASSPSAPARPPPTLDPAAAEAAAAAAAWERASRELASAPAWLAVAGDARRRQLCDAYVAAARQLCRGRAEAAVSALREVLLRAGADDDGGGTPYDEVRPLVDADPRVALLPAWARAKLYAAHLRAARVARAERSAALRVAARFRAQLESCAAPRIAASTPWAAARAQLEGDPAYAAIPEERRVALFGVYVAELREQQEQQQRQQRQEERGREAAATASSAASLASAGSLSSFDSADDAALSPEDLAQLRVLRQEQARLRDEYERMERKLREVEGRLAASPSPAASPSSSPSPSPSAPPSSSASSPEEHEGREDGGSPVEVGAVVSKSLDDGAVLFRFD